MTGVSSAPGPPDTFGYSSIYNNWTPELNQLLKGDHADLNYQSLDDDRQPSTRSKKRSKQSKTKHTKRSKPKRRSHIHGYLLQIIGVVCFILAAIKSYEPLTGIGFTLVVLGYNKNAKKDRRIGKCMHNNACYWKYANATDRSLFEQTKTQKLCSLIEETG